LYRATHEGTYREIGLRNGEQLARQGFRTPPWVKHSSDFAKESEHELRRTFPEVCEEIEGLAEGTRIPYEEMTEFLLRIGIGPATPSCSAFAVFDGSRVVFGRNYDFYYDMRAYASSVFYRPNGAYASVGHSDIFVGQEDGINERGFAVAISFVAPASVEPGVNFPLAVRCLLDTSSNVDEAVQTLKSMRISTTNNYLLADSTGAMAVAEVSPRKVKIRYAEADNVFLVATNHFVSPEMRDEEARERRDADSVQRYEAITEGIRSRRAGLQLEDAEKILADHDGAVCSHHDHQKLGTLWSVVADLGQGTIRWADGHPCEADYVPEDRLRPMSRG
jgi:predicted choloylglycine hydrolase